MVFVLDNVARDAHAQSSTLADRLRGEEILEEALFYQFRHALAIIADGDRYLVVGHSGFDTDLGLIVFRGVLRAFPYSVAGIVHQVQYGTAEVLRDDHRLRQVLLIVLMDADIELLIVGTHSVI